MVAKSKKQKKLTIPNTFTNKKKALFIIALRKMPNVARACDAVDISRRAAYYEKTKDKLFAEDWNDAIEHSLDEMEAVAWERAKRKKAPSDTLLIFMLKGYRKKFSDKIQISDPDGNNPLLPLANALREALDKD